MLFGRQSDLGPVTSEKSFYVKALNFFALGKTHAFSEEAMNDLNVYATPNGAFSPSAEKKTRFLTSTQ